MSSCRKEARNVPNIFRVHNKRILVWCEKSSSSTWFWKITFLINLLKISFFVFKRTYTLFRFIFIQRSRLAKFKPAFARFLIILSQNSSSRELSLLSSSSISVKTIKKRYNQIDLLKNLQDLHFLVSHHFHILPWTFHIFR